MTATNLYLRQEQQRVQMTAKTGLYENPDPDPENVLLISKRKQRHLRRGDCLEKQILIDSVVKQASLKISEKYFSDFNFTSSQLTVL